MKTPPARANDDHTLILPLRDFPSRLDGDVGTAGSSAHIQMRPGAVRGREILSDR